MLCCSGERYRAIMALLFFNTLLKIKNKICIKQVKGLHKKFLHFFWLFIFVLLLFGPILKYRKNKSAKGSNELII